MICPECENYYPVKNGIPCMVKGGPEKQNWNVWDLNEIQMIGSSYYKRAKGELPEKESSKSYARLLKRKNLYSSGDSILDIGCATGHFLRSFRKYTDPEILYTGIDTHFHFLQWGKEVYGVNEQSNFVNCDALHTPFIDNSFSIVTVKFIPFFPTYR